MSKQIDGEDGDVVLVDRGDEVLCRSTDRVRHGATAYCTYTA